MSKEELAKLDAVVKEKKEGLANIQQKVKDLSQCKISIRLLFGIVYLEYRVQGCEQWAEQRGT